jgi:hypothetical protein
VGDTADGTYGRKIESPVARVVDPAIWQPWFDYRIIIICLEKGIPP